MDATHKLVRDPGPEPQSEHGGCRAVADALARIGDKWTVLVVGSLSKGPLRYNELSRMIEGISQRMLTLTLKGLEQDGLVTRTMYATIPPRVEYELTEVGRTLIAPLHGLFEWAVKYQAQMDDARMRYEESRREDAVKMQGVHRAR